MVNYCKIIFILIFCNFILCSCHFHRMKLTKDNFYEYSMLESDVWRLPIIYPYQLTSAYCCNSWTIGIYNHYGHIFGSPVSPDSINYNNNHIILHHIYSSGLLPWQVINIKTKQKFQFKDYNSICQFRRENNISNTMYSCEELFNNWRNIGQLPWIIK